MLNTNAQSKVIEILEEADEYKYLDWELKSNIDHQRKIRRITNIGWKVFGNHWHNTDRLSFNIFEMQGL